MIRRIGQPEKTYLEIVEQFYFQAMIDNKIIERRNKVACTEQHSVMWHV